MKSQPLTFLRLSSVLMAIRTLGKNFKGWKVCKAAGVSPCWGRGGHKGLKLFWLRNGFTLGRKLANYEENNMPSEVQLLIFLFLLFSGILSSYILW